MGLENATTVGEIVTHVGILLYGEAFSIEEETLKTPYKKTFENFKKKKGKKGVLVIGQVGSGKSAMMKVYQRMFKDTERRFKLVKAYELKDMSEEMTTGQIKEIYGSDLKCDLYIDDIGINQDAKRYGNTVNIISEIIVDRYELFINAGYRTHFSSNVIAEYKGDINDPKSKMPTLRSLYGGRVLDRIKEMCDIIVFKGTSLRK